MNFVDPTIIHTFFQIDFGSASAKIAWVNFRASVKVVFCERRLARRQRVLSEKTVVDLDEPDQNFCFFMG